MKTIIMIELLNDMNFTLAISTAIFVYLVSCCTIVNSDHLAWTFMLLFGLKIWIDKVISSYPLITHIILTCFKKLPILHPKKTTHFDLLKKYPFWNVILNITAIMFSYFCFITLFWSAFPVWPMHGSACIGIVYMIIWFSQSPNLKV